MERDVTNGKEMMADLPVLDQLLTYIEEKMSSSQHLDYEEDHLTLSDTDFKSSIHFDGQPILPPLMTSRRRAEMQMYRRQAMMAETRIQARARHKLLAKVQNVLDSIQVKSTLADTEELLSAAATTSSNSARLTPNTQLSTENCESRSPQMSSYVPEHYNGSKMDGVNVGKYAVENEDIQGLGADEDVIVTAVEEGDITVSGLDEEAVVGISAEETDNAIFSENEVANESMKEGGDREAAIIKPTNKKTDMTVPALQLSPRSGYDSASDLDEEEAEDNQEETAVPVKCEGREDVAKVMGEKTPSPRTESKVTPDSGLFSKDQTGLSTEEEEDEGMLDTMAEVTDISSEEQDNEIQQLSSDEEEEGEEGEGSRGESDSQSKSEEDSQVSQIETMATNMMLKNKDKQAFVQASYKSTSSSGTTGSSEEMNRTVISKEEAEFYQSGENIKVLLDEGAGMMTNEGVADTSIASSEGSNSSVVKVPSRDELSEREALVEIDAPEDVETQNQETQTLKHGEAKYVSGHAEDEESVSNNNMNTEEENGLCSMVKGDSTLQQTLLSRVDLADLDASDEMDGLQVISMSDDTPAGEQGLDENSLLNEFTSPESRGEVTPVKKASKMDGSPMSENSLIGQYQDLPTPGPVRTPDLSVISGGDESSISDIHENLAGTQLPTALDVPRPVSGHSAHNKSCDISTMYTGSTDLGKYMAGSLDTIHSSITSLPHYASPIHEEEEQRAESVTPTPSTQGPKHADSAHNTAERVKRGSYTLEKPSPALLQSLIQSPEQDTVPVKHASHAEAACSDRKVKNKISSVKDRTSTRLSHNAPSHQNTEVAAFNLTSSMEDLKLRPVQRQLHYDSADDSAGLAGERQTREEVMHRERTESEKEGKEEHLHRYLSHLSQMPQPLSHVTPEKSTKSSSGTSPGSGYPQSADELNQSDISSASHSGSRERVAQGSGTQVPLSGLDMESLGSLTEGDLLQVQVEYFEQLKQQMMQQQQQQLTQLLAEQQKQQLLFQEEIMKRGTQFKTKLNKTMPNMIPLDITSSSINEQLMNLSLGQMGKGQLPLSNVSMGQMVGEAWQMAGLDSALQHMTSMEMAAMLPAVTKPCVSSSTERPVSAPTPKVSFSAVVSGSPPDEGSPPSVNVHYYTPEHSAAPSPEPQTVLRASSHKKYQKETKDASPSPKGNVRSPATRAQRPSPIRNTVPVELCTQDIPFELHQKFVKMSAAVKGYLTRRLLRTEKVQYLIKTVRDTAQFAINFTQETAIKQGIYTIQDKILQDRVLAQLTATMYEIHDIFCEINTKERMNIIAQDRALKQEKKFRQVPASDVLQSNKSSPKQRRVSSATRKAMERKRKAKAAEAALFGELRPKSAPPGVTTSPRSPRHMKNTRSSITRSSDKMSGAIRRNYMYLMSRAMKPTQALHSPRSIKDTLNSAIAMKSARRTYAAGINTARTGDKKSNTANTARTTSTNVTRMTATMPSNTETGKAPKNKTKATGVAMVRKTAPSSARRTPQNIIAPVPAKKSPTPNATLNQNLTQSVLHTKNIPAHGQHSKTNPWK